MSARNQPLQRQAAQKKRNLERVQAIKMMLAQKRAEKAEDDAVQEHP